MDALTPDLELRLRTELADQQVADLKAALENMKGERDWWRTIAERRSDRATESALSRSESREWWWRLTGVTPTNGLPGFRSG
jgi:hypothetical protein